MNPNHVAAPISPSAMPSPAPTSLFTSGEKTITSGPSTPMSPALSDLLNFDDEDFRPLSPVTSLNTSLPSGSTSRTSFTPSASTISLPYSQPAALNASLPSASISPSFAPSTPTTFTPLSTPSVLPAVRPNPRSLPVSSTIPLPPSARPVPRPAYRSIASPSLPSASTSRTTTPLPSPASTNTSLHSASTFFPSSAHLPQPAHQPARCTPVSTSPALPAPSRAALSNQITPELWSSPLPDELLPFPYLSRHIASLPSQERDDEIARVMRLSEHDRIQEDKGLEAYHQLNAEPFLINFDNVDYEFFAQSIHHASPLNPLIQEDGGNRNVSKVAEKTQNVTQRVSDEGVNSVNTTPTKSQPLRAARISLKFPSSPSAGTSTVPDFSSNASTSTSYTLPSHPNQSATASMAPLAAVDMGKFPEWLKTWYLNFSKLPYGQPWLILVNKWTELEKGYGFKSPVSTKLESYLYIY
jgi:hypothetical protein